MISNAASLAPWLAAARGVLAAVRAEQAFRYGRLASPPDRWRGADTFSHNFDHREEIAERMGRDCAREVSAAWQATATYLAASAAIEAAAASQHGIIGVPLALLGLADIIPAWIIHLGLGLARRTGAILASGAGYGLTRVLHVGG